MQSTLVLLVIAAAFVHVSYSASIAARTQQRGIYVVPTLCSKYLNDIAARFCSSDSDCDFERGEVCAEGCGPKVCAKIVDTYPGVEMADNQQYSGMCGLLPGPVPCGLGMPCDYRPCFFPQQVCCPSDCGLPVCVDVNSISKVQQRPVHMQQMDQCSPVCDFNKVLSGIPCFQDWECPGPFNKCCPNHCNFGPPGTCTVPVHMQQMDQMDECKSVCDFSTMFPGLYCLQDSDCPGQSNKCCRCKHGRPGTCTLPVAEMTGRFPPRNPLLARSQQDVGCPAPSCDRNSLSLGLWCDTDSDCLKYSFPGYVKCCDSACPVGPRKICTTSIGVKIAEENETEKGKPISEYPTVAAKELEDRLMAVIAQRG